MDSLNQVLQGTAFDVLVRGHPDGIFIFTLAGEMVDCNDAVLKMTGASKEELLSRSFEPLDDPEYRVKRDEIFRAALAGATSSYTARARAKFGDSFLVEVTNLPIRNDDGEVVGVMGIARDISELVQALDEADSGQSISRMAGRIARFAGWKLDVLAREVQMSEELVAILGVDAKDPPRRVEDFSMFYDQDHWSQVAQAVLNCIENGSSLDLQCKVRNMSGQILDVRMQGEVVRNDSGVVTRIDGALYDITSLVRQQDEMRELEHRVATTLNQVDTPMAFVNRDWRFTFVNRAVLTLTGRTLEEIMSRTLWENFPIPEDSPFGALYRGAMDEGRAGSVRAFTELYQRWFEATAHPGTDGIVISIRDITAEYEAQEKIDEYVARVTFLAQMLDLAKDAMIVRDFDQGITYWNKAAEEMYGWSFEEVQHKKPSEILYDDPQVSDDTLEAVLRDGFWKGELIHRRRDGQHIIVDCRRQLIRDANNNPIGVFGVNTDITLAVREKEQRVRAQRMESLGTLAGGIAHDLNNVFTPLLMSIELLEREDHDLRHQTLLSSMEASVKRGADMIRQVLSFARGVEGVRESFSVSALLSEVYELCRDTLPKNIDVVFDIADDLLALSGDSTQLMQVVMNLVTNARDAMSEGGRLTVRALNGVVDGLLLDEFSTSGDVQAVVIEVIDNGVGMENFVASRIFEPFFTTKRFGEGTGLGLSTSLAIVKSHGGRIDVESVLGEGTQFKVVLPSASRSEGSATSTDATESLRLRGEGRRILVVDDEVPILTMLNSVLQSEGFDVDVAENGEHALETLATANYYCDLIISDLSMPQLGGEQLVHTLRERKSDVPVILMSGVNPGPTSYHLLGEKTVPFLQKPFTTKELFDQIDAALT
ncbi:MAG: PAS domain-containing hybrid sensor histidine kinase/response regulator [Acidimicrobiales bacterium]